MSRRLKQIQNWSELLPQANWSVTKLAALCEVSVRTLERHILKQMGQCPKAWLTEQRLKQAVELLLDGSSVKETATLLGYEYAHHFSGEFRAHWGRCPTDFQDGQKTMPPLAAKGKSKIAPCLPPSVSPKKTKIKVPTQSNCRISV